MSDNLRVPFDLELAKQGIPVEYLVEPESKCIEPFWSLNHPWLKALIERPNDVYLMKGGLVKGTNHVIPERIFIKHQNRFADEYISTSKLRMVLPENGL